MTELIWKIADIKHKLRRQYPLGMTTWGVCSHHTECKNAARGSGHCASCCENELANLIGSDLATQYHNAVKNLASIEYKISEST
ncbi:hypothetical protein [Endozoicomonas sp. Mp262]|uniref:hypothetical protein n=1 Tax=Endozoicomonas sp. Mp262 TaxID=2919499 RepID=UPI0021D88051